MALRFRRTRRGRFRRRARFRLRKAGFRRRSTARRRFRRFTRRVWKAVTRRAEKKARVILSEAQAGAAGVANALNVDLFGLEQGTGVTQRIGAEVDVVALQFWVTVSPYIRTPTAGLAEGPVYNPTGYATGALNNSVAWFPFPVFVCLSIIRSMDQTGATNGYLFTDTPSAFDVAGFSTTNANVIPRLLLNPQYSRTIKVIFQKWKYIHPVWIERVVQDSEGMGSLINFWAGMTQARITNRPAYFRGSLRMRKRLRYSIAGDTTPNNVQYRLIAFVLPAQNFVSGGASKTTPFKRDELIAVDYTYRLRTVFTDV